LEPKQWYFAPIAKIFADNPDATKTEGFAKCQLLENVNKYSSQLISKNIYFSE